MSEKAFLLPVILSEKTGLYARLSQSRHGETEAAIGWPSLMEEWVGYNPERYRVVVRIGETISEAVARHREATGHGGMCVLLFEKKPVGAPLGVATA